MNSCIFCTAPSTSHENGKVAPVIVKEEALITSDDDDDYHPLHDPLSEPVGGSEIGGKPCEVPNHLKAPFILTTVLKLPQHSVSQILEHHLKNKDAFYPPEEDQVSLKVCASCGVSVANFYQTLEQISELERRLAEIETELKLKMRNSSQVLIQPGSINQLIRSLVLNEPIPTATQQDAPVLHFNHNHSDLESEVEVVKEEIMSNENIHEDHHHTFISVDRLENDDKDETEEFKLNLGYIEHDPAIPEEAECRNSLKQAPVKLATTTRRRLAGASPRNYPCDHCPYRSNNKQQLDEHAMAHEKGSPCLTCGWYVLPENISHHRQIRHRRKTEKVEKEAKTKKKWITKYRRCPECQALVCGKLRDFRDHQTMHLVGSGFECSLCHWLCISIAHHNARWHPKNKEPQMPLNHQIIKMPKK
ncbi:RE1-silencing transcription factor [Orchesella cincta]|uniref:RE1-silencing transcription factor n=1 Tax=Orchesella cincta TaxID=48709 RepID=A0A1D2MSH5_ORCCI|nr:RE1-silencing transcription factor [Orchesella cincta]